MKPRASTGAFALAVFLASLSAYHVTIRTLTLADGRKVDVDMIAPGQQVRLPLPAGDIMPTQVSFQWLDDYGTPRGQDATVGG